MRLTPRRALLLGGFTDFSAFEKKGLKLKILLVSVLFSLLFVSRLSR